jgi:hypothetical protein
MSDEGSRFWEKPISEMTEQELDRLLLKMFLARELLKPPSSQTQRPRSPSLARYRYRVKQDLNSPRRETALQALEWERFRVRAAEMGSALQPMLRPLYSITSDFLIPVATTIAANIVWASMSIGAKLTQRRPVLTRDQIVEASRTAINHQWPGAISVSDTPVREVLGAEWEIEFQRDFSRHGGRRLIYIATPEGQRRRGLKDVKVERRIEFF